MGKECSKNVKYLFEVFHSWMYNTHKLIDIIKCQFDLRFQPWDVDSLGTINGWGTSKTKVNRDGPYKYK